MRWVLYTCMEYMDLNINLRSIQKHAPVKHDGFCNSNKALKGCVLEAHFKDHVLWNVLFSYVLWMTEKREHAGIFFFFLLKAHEFCGCKVMILRRNLNLKDKNFSLLTCFETLPMEGGWIIFFFPFTFSIHIHPHLGTNIKQRK